jgi:hypothetical protein
MRSKIAHALTRSDQVIDKPTARRMRGERGVFVGGDGIV